VTAAIAPANADPHPDAALLGTSCPAPGNCVATGTYRAGGQTFPFADYQSNGTWSPVELPLPSDVNNADPVSEVTGISCPSVGSCVVIGDYNKVGGITMGFIDTGWGGTWSTMVAPLPANASASTPDPFPVGLACPSVGSCVVSGGYHDNTNQSQGLLLTLSGGAWTPEEAPLPGNANPVPNVFIITAACAASGSCFAAGYYHDTSNNEEPLLLSLSGGIWTDTEGPVPSDAAPNPQVGFTGSACAAPGTCYAVGEYANVAGGTSGIIETLAGGTATGTEAPLPSDARTTGSPAPHVTVFGVSCPSATWCEAVGGYTSTAGAELSPMAETLASGTWTPSALPGGGSSPTTVTFAQGISCSWPGSCAAVGVSATGGPPSGAIWSLTAGAWTETPAVLPPDSVSPPESYFGLGELPGAAVSCVAGTCAASGVYVPTGAPGAGFIDTFPNLTGYQMVASDGGLFAFNTPFFGSMGGMPLNEPVVGMAVVPDSGGYYEVASDGGIFAFNAPFYGSMGGKPLNEPIVGIAFDTLTGGYYEVASDGGIFAFNAPFLGSMGGKPLNEPIVGIAFDPATGGYYEVASDGGLFAFGAPFLGSTGGMTLNKPVVGMTVDTSTGGYYEVASDGGLFAYGAPFLGSEGGSPINKPVVGMAYDYATGGYYEVASDGGIFAFGAPFQGSTGNLTLNKPVVGMAFG